MWAALFAAILVHGTVLGTVQAFGVTMIGKGLGTRSSAKSVPAAYEPELEASCAGDAMLAASGRSALCFAPWVADVDQCLADAQMSLWMDLSGCQARNDPNTAIAMIEQRTADRLKPIDAERLLLDVAQPDKPKPPPPPQLAELQPATPPPPPPPPPPQQQRPQQVIETVKPNDDKEPENARFLSEYNTRVEKEQVARGARNEPMIAKSKPEELTPKAQPKEDPAVEQLEPDRVAGRNERAPDVPGHLSMRKPGASSPGNVEQEARVRGSTTGTAPSQAGDDGYLARKGDGAIDQQRQERSEVASGQGGAGGGAPRVPNLKPSSEALERALGGGSVDHLENVADGEETALSSKRWVYASFFNRLKRQVAQNWDPERVWRQTDPSGARYGTKTRITEVRVSLSSHGELTKIVVTTPSGVNELDSEAVRAFKSAAPFTNPPAGLVQKDNQITFAFSFFFEIGAPRVTWRLPQAM